MVLTGSKNVIFNLFLCLTIDRLISLTFANKRIIHNQIFGNKKYPCMHLIPWLWVMGTSLLIVETRRAWVIAMVRSAVFRKAQSRSKGEITCSMHHTNTTRRAWATRRLKSDGPPSAAKQLPSGCSFGKTTANQNCQVSEGTNYGHFAPYQTSTWADSPSINVIVVLRW